MTRSLKNSCALIALTAATMLSGVAQAQDVVVMRRAIAPPNKTLDGVNAPSTPTPIPTASATPTDSATYKVVVRTLGDPYSYYAGGTSRYANAVVPANEVTVAVSDTSCVDASDGTVVSVTKCRGLGGPSVNDRSTLPAQMDADLRAVYVTRAALQGIDPAIGPAELDRMCNSSIVIGPSGSTQTWKLSCDPKSVINSYERFVYGLGDPFNYYASLATRYVNTQPSGTTVKLAVADARCWDNATNAYASDQSRCTNLAKGYKANDRITVGAAYSQNLRTIAISKAEVLSLLPHYTQSMNTGDLNNLCTGSLAIGTAAGGTVSYKLRCDPAEVSEHYERFAYGLGDPFSYYATTATRYQNESGTASAVNIALADVRCWDTATKGYASDQSKCTYLPTGVNVYDVFTVAATISQNLRTVAIDKAEVLAKLPHYTQSVNTGDLNNLCNGSVQIGTASNGVVSYKLRCSPADVAEHYERFAYGLGDPFNYYANSAQRYQNPSPTATTVNIAVSDARCWDTDTDGYASDQSKCTYLQTGINTNDLVNVSATISQNLRTIAISKAEVLAKLPHYTTKVNTGDLNNLCTSDLRIGTSSGTTSYKLRCDPAEVSEHYERYVYAWGDPYSYFKTVGDRFKNPSSTATSVVLAAADVRCWDTTAKAYAADQSKCTYLPTGPNAPDQYTVAATFDSTARTITMLRSDLQALSPNMTTAYLNAVCSATTQVGTSGTTVSYSNKCQ